MMYYLEIAKLLESFDFISFISFFRFPNHAAQLEKHLSKY